MASMEIARAAFALIAVLGLIGLFAFAARRFGPRAGRGARRLELVETLSLDAKRRLAVVRWDNEEHLIALGPEPASPIAARPSIAKATDAAPPEMHGRTDAPTAQTTSQGASFAAAVKEAEADGAEPPFNADDERITARGLARAPAAGLLSSEIVLQPNDKTNETARRTSADDARTAAR